MAIRVSIRPIHCIISQPLHYPVAVQKRSNSGSVWNKFYNLVNPPEEAHDVLAIWSASESSTHVTQFKAFDDRSYGGFSSCQIEVIDGSNESRDALKYLKFSGYLKFNPDIAKKTSTKGSFCGFKGTLNRQLDLRDFEGLELTLRSNKDLVFTFNLGMISLFDGDMYQIGLSVPKSTEWLKYQIPFSLFRLTANGREREIQRLNDSLQIESFGFLLRQSVDVDDFSLDLMKVAALPEVDYKKIHRSLLPK